MILRPENNYSGQSYKRSMIKDYDNLVVMTRNLPGTKNNDHGMFIRLTNS